MKFFTLVILLFICSCTKNPANTLESLNDDFKKEYYKLKTFPKTHAKNRRKTRDFALIEQYFQIAQELIIFSENNCSIYQDSMKALQEDSEAWKHFRRKHKGNKYLNFKRVAYQYSKRNLEDVLQMVKKRIETNNKYYFKFSSLSLPVIFKTRPAGQKPGGSKKFESIRKKFSSD